MYSIIIPAYNEENRLPYTLNTLRDGLGRYKEQYEIIVVDDGSTDNTCEVAKNENVIRQPCNMGKGAAITAGLKVAQGDTVFILDADMPTTVDELIRLGNITGYDLVIGSRRMSNSRVYRSKAKKIVSWIFGYVVRTITGLPYNDTQCGVKVLRAPAVKRILPLLTEKGFLFDVDLLYLANITGCKVREEGIIWIDRAGSKVDVWSDSIKMALGLIALRRKYRRIEPKPVMPCVLAKLD